MKKFKSFYQFIEHYKFNFSKLFGESDMDLCDECSYFSSTAHLDRKFPKLSSDRGELESYISTANPVRFYRKHYKIPYPKEVFEKLWDKYSSMYLA